MKKLFVFVAGIFTMLACAKAQNETFPLLFSQYGLNGTASYIGKAGAIGALGGDIMSASYNPAGIGMYRSSEFVFSLGADYSITNSNFQNSLGRDARTSINFGTAGMVLNIPNSTGNWKNVQFSMGINRLNNFNGKAKIFRENLPSSFINDVILDEITSVDDDFITSGVVDTTVVGENVLISSVFENGTFDQIKSIREKGYLNEATFTLSGNYNNILFVGATLGIPFGSFSRETSFTEERFVAGQSTGFYNYNTLQELSTVGVNLKVGAIVRPVSWIRLGAAIHTPTLYEATDDYYAEVDYNKWAGGWYSTLNYGMYSPWRFIGSAAIVLGNSTSPISGTLSADYEYADYSTMSFNMNDDIRTESVLNNNIENCFTGAGTLRLGAEVKLSGLYLRAGYANYGNPYKNDINSASWDYLTFGVGFRTGSCYFDIAYAHGKASKDYYMYANDGVQAGITNPATELETSKNIIQTTFGIRF